eukprot:4450827-Lingulodinium_polyedra.AAC.1
MPWPAKGPEEKWRAEEDPDSATRVWISTKGKCGGTRAPKEEFITFEERNSGANDLDPWIRDFETVQDSQWK